MISGLGLLAATLLASAEPSPANPPAAGAAPAPAAAAKSLPPARTGPNAFFEHSEVVTKGSVRIGGRAIPYRAVAGTLVVHAKDWQDTDWLEFNATRGKGDPDEPKPEASMFYAAYFRDGVPSAGRPITFVFNGGPGSSSTISVSGASGTRTVSQRNGP